MERQDGYVVAMETGTVHNLLPGNDVARPAYMHHITNLPPIPGSTEHTHTHAYTHTAALWEEARVPVKHPDKQPHPQGRNQAQDTLERGASLRDTSGESCFCFWTMLTTNAQSPQGQAPEDNGQTDTQRQVFLSLWQLSYVRNLNL